MAIPINWRDTFQVNTGAAATGGQSNSTIVGLSNGNILVAWEEDDAGTIGGIGDADIIGKIYDAQGALVRAPFIINAGRFTDDEQDFDIAATNDGGFILAYVDNDDETLGDTAVIWERFDALGNLVFFREIATEMVAADFFANPQIAVDLTDNSSYVTFTDDVGTDTDIRGVRLDAQGIITTAEFDVGQNSIDLDTDGDSAILRNGNLVTVYEEYDGGSPTIELRINLPDGTSAALLQASNFNGTDIDPQVASLRNGGFVVVWNRISDPVAGAISDIQYRVFDAAGNPTTAILNAVSGAALENEPDVAALPDGSFVIIWDDDTNDLTRGRRYNADGSPDGARFNIQQVNGTFQDVGAAADGRILTTWSDASGGEIFASIWDARGSTIEASSFDGLPRNFVETRTVTAFAGGGTLRGTDEADTLFGSNAADTIRGLAGNDVLSGRGGNDKVFGGTGNDKLAGGGGKNVLDGQSGRDTADYSASSSRVVADLTSPSKNVGAAARDTHVSIENLIGTAFNDTLSGDSARNTLSGGRGHDRLLGLANEDRLVGGRGNDTLNGGGHNDLLTGGADADTFRFNRNDGDDTITDFLIGVDKISIGTGASNLGDLDISQFGTDTLIEFANVTIILENVIAGNLSAADFTL
jgi:Ca2+-binding RTX toxin-like protein